MRVPLTTTTVDEVQLTGALTDERPEYPGQVVLVVDGPVEHAGIWTGFDDRKPGPAGRPWRMVREGREQ